MSVYPLMKDKNGGAMHPQSTSYSEEYAERMCDLYLTEEHSRDEHGRVHRQYRLHARHPHTTDYKNHFWNALRGRTHSEAVFEAGRNRSTGSYTLPTASEGSYDKAIRKEGLFRNIATVVRAYGGSSRIFAKDCEDLAIEFLDGKLIRREAVKALRIVA